MKFNIEVKDTGIEADLKEIPRKAKKAVMYAGRKASREGTNELKGTSPKLYGDYAAGWSVRAKNEAGANPEWWIHNRTHWGLVHLLDDGHYLVYMGIHTGDYVDAIPHFSEPTVKAGDNFVEYIDMALD